MDPKLAGIIEAVVANIVIPEVVAWLKGRKTTEVPTEEELRLLLATTTARAIAVGQAFLLAHGITP